MSRFKPPSTSWAQSPTFDGGRALAVQQSFSTVSPAKSPAPAPTPELPATPEPATTAPPAPARNLSWLAEANNPLREFGFLFALAFLFTRFSMVNQLIEFKTGVSTFMTYLFGVPALLVMVSTGGIQRALRSTAALLFFAFMLWMVAVTPFSLWPGGSFKVIKDSFLVEFPLLFLVAGLTVTRVNIERMFRGIALSGTVIVVCSFLFGTTWGDRLALSYGTVANPNDLATHILTTLPFVGWAFASDRSQISFMKFCWVLTMLGASIVILKTGSRSGLLAFGVMMLIALFKMSAIQRILIVSSIFLVMAVTFAFAPGVLVQRYLTLFSKNPAVDYMDDEQLVEARGSSEARKNLLKASIKITLQNPLVGVGPGQFAVAENDDQKRLGRTRGAWQVTHNSYTEVSSETGIPGLLLFAGSFFLCFFSLRRLSSAPLSTPEVRRFATCLMLSIAAFAVCITFASLAYRFYLPTLIGLTTVVIRWANSPEALGNRRAA